MTPSGIEPTTFRFVAQHLNHCATAVPACFYISVVRLLECIVTEVCSFCPVLCRHLFDVGWTIWSVVHRCVINIKPMKLISSCLKKYSRATPPPKHLWAFFKNPSLFRGAVWHLVTCYVFAGKDSLLPSPTAFPLSYSTFPWRLCPWYCMTCACVHSDPQYLKVTVFTRKLTACHDEDRGPEKHGIARVWRICEQGKCNGVKKVWIVVIFTGFGLLMLVHLFLCHGCCVSGCR